jgi:hypothetical protein
MWQFRPEITQQQRTAFSLRHFTSGQFNCPLFDTHTHIRNPNLQ